MLLVSLGLVYVWLDCQCNAFGKAIKSLELERDDLQKQAGLAQYRWAQLKSPRGLDAALSRCHVSMGTPQGDQIVKLNQPDLSGSQVAQANAYTPTFVRVRGARRDE